MSLVFTTPVSASPIRNGGTGSATVVALGGGLVYTVDVENAVWEIHKPWNSTTTFLPGIGDVPQTFTPDVPGRYLIRAVMDDLIGAGPTITFTALFEVEDAYISGHGIPASTESDEANLPSNEGWGTEMGERVSRLGRATYGNQRVVTVENTTGLAITRGTPVTWGTTPYTAWLGVGGSAVGTPPDWFSQVELLLATAAPAGGVGLVLADIPDGERGYVQVEGPFIGIDTSAYILTDDLYVTDAGALDTFVAAAAAYPIRMGEVVAVGVATGATPGILALVGPDRAAQQHSWPIPETLRTADATIFADGTTNDINVFEAELLTPGGADRWAVRRYECVTATHFLAQTWFVIVQDTPTRHQQRTADVVVQVPYQLENASCTVSVTVYENAASGAASVTKVGSTVSSTQEFVTFTWAELHAGGLDLTGTLGTPQLMEVRATVTLDAIADVAYVGDVTLFWGE